MTASVFQRICEIEFCLWKAASQSRAAHAELNREAVELAAKVQENFEELGV